LTPLSLPKWLLVLEVRGVKVSRCAGFYADKYLNVHKHDSSILTFGVARDTNWAKHVYMAAKWWVALKRLISILPRIHGYFFPKLFFVVHVDVSDMLL